MAKSGKTHIRPLGDRVLVRPLSEVERGSQTKAGIFIPDTAESERPEQGTVIAVGPGKMGEDGKALPMQTKTGQVVLFTKYGPDEIKVDGERYLVVSESNILAVIE
ncbi:MAG: co-chaperone GroES [Candidatus Vogelbacteria bacterium]|nr:co-chaperone GroES [Candidatus Vogelbacteria bacterium]